MFGSRRVSERREVSGCRPVIERGAAVAVAGAARMRLRPTPARLPSDTHTARAVNNQIPNFNCFSLIKAASMSAAVIIAAFGTSGRVERSANRVCNGSAVMSVGCGVRQ